MTIRHARILILSWLLIITALITYSVTAQDNVNIIVVHSGESLTITWNPLTHEEVRNEVADGDMILTIQPKKKAIEQTR